MPSPTPYPRSATAARRLYRPPAAVAIDAPSSLDVPAHAELVERSVAGRTREKASLFEEAEHLALAEEDRRLHRAVTTQAEERAALGLVEGADLLMALAQRVDGRVWDQARLGGLAGLFARIAGTGDGDLVGARSHRVGAGGIGRVVEGITAHLQLGPNMVDAGLQCAVAVVAVLALLAVGLGRREVRERKARQDRHQQADDEDEAECDQQGRAVLSLGALRGQESTNQPVLLGP